MTHLLIPWYDESVPVTVNRLTVEAEDAGLQRIIDFILARHVVKPMVNMEHWTANLVIDNLGGEMLTKPPYDPNAGDIV